MGFMSELTHGGSSSVENIWC